MRTFLEARIEAAHAIFKSGTVKVDLEKGFALKIHDKYPEAPLSPIYVSLRPQGTKGGKLSAKDMAAIGKSMSLYALDKGLIESNPFISGIPAAGEPIVDAMQSLRFMFLTKRIRLIKETSGDKRHISDVEQESQPLLVNEKGVLLIDDLVTKAETKLEAIAAIERYNAKVSDLLVFLDRSTDASAILAEQGVKLHSIWTFSDLLLFARNCGYIRRVEYDAIASYPETLSTYIEKQK